jgi:preprotein translocase subunit SecA
MPTLASFHLADFWTIVQPRPSPPQLLEAIHAAAGDLSSRSDDSLRRSADELRAAVRTGADMARKGILVPAFALVLEATRRVHGIALFDTQLLAGMAMAQGAIAEMATGEGKTLAAALPAMLFSLRGPGVHVATPNFYLARRDFERIGPILQLLGTSVGLAPEGGGAPGRTPLAPREALSFAEREECLAAKRAAYACDVTYATGYELGFDYLRDQLQVLSTPRPGLGERQLELLRGEPAWRPAPVQPLRSCAIIDEIDSVLIDEAYLPLVLSDGREEVGHRDAYFEARRIAASLVEGDDFVLDAQARSVKLTPAGRQSVYEQYANRLRFPLDRPWAEYVEHALAARHLFQRDVDYIVQAGCVMLVDEFTGRIFADRTWRDGLHQAVEAKEGLLPSPELRTAARISRQRFFRLYETICGMTGTASGSRGEFRRHFGLAVRQIPLRKSSRRETLPSRFFVDAESKYRAVVVEVLAMHRAGRPVVIGARTIRNSELLAERLAAEAVPLELLNGRQDRAEAEVIARAGRRDAVTIATNMAGRGTDIVLGPGAAEAGGMHVIGVECHESGRIDRQLLGRAGRQGDPGSGRFFISADDPLLVRFAPRLSRRMERMPNRAGEIDADLSRELLVAQRAAEAAAFAGRRRMLGHDRWIGEMLKMLS